MLISFLSLERNTLKGGDLFWLTDSGVSIHGSLAPFFSWLVARQNIVGSTWWGKFSSSWQPESTVRKSRGPGSQYTFERHTSNDLFPPTRPHFLKFLPPLIAPPAAEQAFNPRAFGGHSRSKLPPPFLEAQILPLGSDASLVLTIWQDRN